MTPSKRSSAHEHPKHHSASRFELGGDYSIEKHISSYVKKVYPKEFWDNHALSYIFKNGKPFAQGMKREDAEQLSAAMTLRFCTRVTIATTTTIKMMAPMAIWPSAFALIPHSCTDSLSDMASLDRGEKRHLARD